MITQTSFSGRTAHWCSECGRALKNPASIERGMGPICAGNHGVIGGSVNQDNITDIYLPIPLTEGIIIRRENGIVRTNVPHLCIHHSPTGFEFGYGGSGPADLALNMVQAVLLKMGYTGPTTPLFNGRCFHLAWELHQGAKWEFISPLPEPGGSFLYEAVTSWIEALAGNRLSNVGEDHEDYRLT